MVVLALGALACGRINFEAGGRTDGGDATDGPVESDADIGTVTAYLKPGITGTNDLFGHRVAISADGSTLAVGAYGESSGAMTINGNATDNSAINAGAVYIFVRGDTGWVAQAYVKPANMGPGDAFGYAIALSADGNTLAVGAPDEDSAATTINGDGANDLANSAGSAYVFTRAGSTWSQQAYLKASNAQTGDNFGEAIAIAADGNTVAVGAWAEDGADVGPNGNPASNTALEAGAVYVFARVGTAWSQQAYLKSTNTQADDMFGIEVALSATGDVLAVAATGEAGSSPGINGNQVDNSSPQAGAVYTYRRTGTAWASETYIKAGNPEGGDFFGYSIALSADGNTLAVTAEGEDGGTSGVNPAITENGAQAGAAYVFTRAGGWSQQAYIKATNTMPDDRFGRSVALSAAGNLLVVGAVFEDSAATGRGGSQLDESASDSGAAYVFTRSGTTWTPSDYLKATNTGDGDQFGHSVGASDVGPRIIVGAWREDSDSTDPTSDAATDAGSVYVFE